MPTNARAKKLNIFLKNQFTRIPWLDIKTNTEFKNEVNRNLKNDGYTNDAMAFKSVITWSLGRYTDYRNQLRRKIITELKKEDLAVVPIEEFAQSIIGGYCSSGVDDSSPERTQLCLLLVSLAITEITLQ
ncbi:uncharacterized protein LOC127703940 [Mytilus californianus]|uniref:uncharacterized protein LOC127703940 n=1 Tax=Mytilus californianus TaxID=6549 RepID=UPI0022456444|nr:uncharacterized protein LOC127703940 [Mytilus californianus]